MSKLPEIRLGADYQCYAVWLRGDGGALKNISPESLKLPEGVVRGLMRWAEVFDDTLDMADPMSSGFATRLEHELFVQWGFSLAQIMADVLGHDVEYFDDLSQSAIILWPVS